MRDFGFTEVSFWLSMKSFIADKNRKLSKLALYHIEDLSFTALMRSLRKKDVKVNGVRVSKDVTLSVGDKVEIYYTATKVENYSLVYKNDDILVVNKFKGITSESLFSEIKLEYPTAAFIHRLDRNTDGIMIFSLNDTAEKELLKGFKDRTFDKKYRALVVGVMNKQEDVLTAYLIKDANKSTVTVYNSPVNGSVQIKTGYKVLEAKDGFSLLEITLYTGKTHQIRAHLAHVGHPIVGDGKYGDFAVNEKLKEKKQNLTSSELKLKFDKDSPLYYLSGKKFTI